MWDLCPDKMKIFTKEESKDGKEATQVSIEKSTSFHMPAKSVSENVVCLSCLRICLLTLLTHYVGIEANSLMNSLDPNQTVWGSMVECLT